MPTPSISADTFAALLLHAPAERGSALSPLTLGEYNALAKWLKDRGARPADLVSGGDLLDEQALLEVRLGGDRLRALLGRQLALSLQLDKWQQRGLWVAGRSDDIYPRRLRAQLRQQAPAYLFGCGDPTLANRSLICAVGSRKPTEDGLAFARALGAACAGLGLGIVSGAAAGVDREAMGGAMFNGGFAVGFLAEGLMKAIGARENRELVADGRLCLLSPFMPDDRWFVSRAMERNKLLYGSGLAAVIVDSDIKGGTWEGARENLKYKWVPASVRAGQGIPEGNARLLREGLHVIEAADVSGARALDDWLNRTLEADKAATSGNADLFAPRERPEPQPSSPPPAPPPALREEEKECRDTVAKDQLPGQGDPVYQAFLGRLADILATAPLAEKEIAEQARILPAQAKVWMQSAEQQGFVVRQGRRRVYALSKARLL